VPTRASGDSGGERMIGMQHEDGTADFLLLGLWSGANERALWRWKELTPELHSFVPDMRRLQLEYWLHKAWREGRIAGRIMDVGVYDRRLWMGDGYFTFGQHECDVTGDLELLYPSDVGGLLDTIIATEVLEHTPDPFQACRRMFECLKPGGRLFASAPFLWPDHGIEGQYADFWRILAAGWRVLLKDFQDVKLTEPAWSTEGEQFYHFLRKYEGWGFAHLVRGNTGYFVEAVRP
jgi:SAM-dependent methyltransferase